MVLDGAPPLLAAGELVVVVGEPTRGKHAQRRMRFEVVDHLVRGVHVDLEQRGIRLDAQRETAQVGQGVLAGVFDAHGGHVLVAGDPGHSAGDPRRPADQRGLLQQQRLGPAVVRQCRGHEAGASRPKHDDIGFAVPLRRNLGRQVRPPAAVGARRRQREGLTAEQLRVAGLDHPPQAVLPMHRGAAQVFVHPVGIRRDAAQGLLGVVELRFEAG